MSRRTLSDGFPICTDYTAAAVITNPERLIYVRDAIQSLGDGTTSISKLELNELLLQNTDETRGLNASEFSAVMACLSNSAAATEAKTSSKGYSEYTFNLDPDAAVRVLDQQLVAVTSQPALGDKGHDTNVQLVATLPREVERQLAVSISRIHLSLRRLVMSASHTVRISNPYFDPDQDIIQDLAALPKRGIQLQLLTREATGEHADADTLAANTELVKELDADHIENIDIRDFYETTETGKQTGAVHAKLISIDDDKCYIGSANLTALNLSGNFEIGVLVEGQVVSEINEIFDVIFETADPVPL